MSSLVAAIERKTAHDFARMVMALCQTKGKIGNAVAASAQWRSPRVANALKGMLVESVDELMTRTATDPGTTTSATFAGALAPALILSREFVEYSRGATVIGRIPGLRKVPPNVRFARTTLGSSASFVQEGYPIPVHKMDLDTLQLGFAKVAAIAVLTQELANSQSYDAPGLVSADLSAAAQQYMDTAFCDPDRAEVIGVSPESITHAGTQISSSGTSPANLAADARRAMLALDSVRVKLAECVWIISQEVAAYIATLLTATTFEPVFEDFSLADGGRWFGLPVITSGALIGGNSPSEGIIILAHPPSIAYADDGVASVSVTGDASLQMDSGPQSGAQQMTSLWAENLAAVKITRYCSWLLRRSGAVCTIRSINL